MAIISGGIWDIDPTVTDGTQLAGYLNELVKAINTNQESATRPPMVKKGGLWTKTLTGSDIAVMVYDGKKDYEIGKVVGGNISLDSIWTETGNTAFHDGNIDVYNIQSNNIVANRLDMTGGSSSVTAAGTLYLVSDTGKSGISPIRLCLGDTTESSLSVNTDRKLQLNGYSDGTHDSPNHANVYMSSAGTIYKSSATVEDKRSHLGITNHEKVTVDNSGAVTIAASLTTGNQIFLKSSGGSNRIEADETLYVVGGGDTRIHTGGSADPHTRFIEDGRVIFTGYSGSDHTSAGKPNMYMSAGGTLFRSTAAFYSAEEVNEVVDLKVKIRDKVINKLADRLEALENILIGKGEKIEKSELNVNKLIDDGEDSIKNKLTELAMQNVNPLVDEPIDKEKEKVVVKKKKK